jgi:hypothetical protein
MDRIKTWLVLALLVGCARGEVVVHPSPAVSASAVKATPPVVPSAPTAAPAEPEKAPAPPSVSVEELTQGFGPQQLRTLDALRSVCPAALKREGERVLLGCTRCPPFDGSARAPEVTVEPDKFFEAEAAYFGNFTNPNAREAALVFRGCEPQSENLGGTLLMSFDGSGWSQKTYASGFRPEECHVFTRPDRRDILVCKWSSDQMMYVHSGVGSYDFTRYDERDAFAAWENLIALEDNSYPACLAEAKMKGPIVADSIAAFDVNAARNVLTLEVRSFHGPRSSAFQQKCVELRERAEDSEPVDLHAAMKFNLHRLTFGWRGKGFVPDAATLALIRRVWTKR